jgi:S1-C subfamily serine protease
MKSILMLAVGLVIGQGDAAAERATTPADATVYIRLVGSVHAELEEAGSAKQTTDLDRIEIGTGSGFVISPHGYVLTNEHVIGNSEFVVEDGPRKAKFALKVSKIEVCFPAGAASASSALARCFDASVHSSDAALDLAVLFVSASDLPYVALGDSDVVTSGQRVEALGYPFGRKLEVARVAAPDLVPEISTSPATISALRAGDGGERRALQINGTINPGNSGGPLVDRDGYAVGVIRARVSGDAGIGFAIPINRAKDFLESRGLDSLMPSRRFTLGAFHTFEGKGIALRLPEGVADTSPFRSRVESDPTLGVTLRIDRSVSPWTSKRIEQTLVGTEAFERLSFDGSESQRSSRSGGAPLLVGRASATSGGNEIGMQYAILELGEEKLVARYVGPAEHLAYNESVFRESLSSLDGQRLTSDQSQPVDSIQWTQGATSAGQLNLPLPVGWVVEPGAPSQCVGLPPPSATSTAYPIQDVTLALRAATWDTRAIVPEDAAVGCSSRRGSIGSSSYTLRAQWLGVSYTIEGVFVRTASSQTVQVEVISPEQKAPFAHALLAAWMKMTVAP